MDGLASFLARGRAAHEDLMEEQIRLYRQGEDVFDRTTGQTVAGPQTVLYNGRARVKPAGQAGEETVAGEREIGLREYEVALPWGTTLPPGTRVVPGDRVAVDASPDPRMPGLILYVTGAQYSSSATAWRLIAEERA